jgi:probable rRNA maturation factor
MPTSIALTSSLPLSSARRLALRRAARLTLRRESVTDATLSITVLGDAEIRRLNRRFLAHDWPTDVLSFDLSDPGEPLSGEVIVSAERAARVAKRRQADAQAELLLYVVHGLLHLCGYDDLSPDKARRMHRRENEILTELGYPDVFAGRPVSNPSPLGEGGTKCRVRG